MRIWHTSLIDVLPLAQVKGQWSELNSIFSKQDNHRLINFVYDYNTVDLYIYALRIIKRATDLGVNIKKYDHFNNYFAEFKFSADLTKLDLTQNIFYDKMNNRYLLQCLCNLQEKFDCGMIPNMEWSLVYDKFKKIFDYIECVDVI